MQKRSGIGQTLWEGAKAVGKVPYKAISSTTPKWMYPLAITATAAPLGAYELNKLTKHNLQAQTRKDRAQRAREEMAQLEEKAAAAIDEALKQQAVRSAATQPAPPSDGIENFKTMLRGAKQRAQSRPQANPEVHGS